MVCQPVAAQIVCKRQISHSKFEWYFYGRILMSVENMSIWFGLIAGIIGIIVGIGMYPGAKAIMIHKLKSRKLEYTSNKLDQWSMRIIIIVLNSFSWGIAGLFGENVFQIIMISLLSSFAIAFAYIDLKIHLIPNEMLLGMLAIGVLYQTIHYGWKAMGIGLLGLIITGAAFMILGLIIGLEKIGAGDVKMAAVMAAVLGYPFILYALLGMSVLLIGYIIIGISIGKLTQVTMFPFAPFIMAGQIFALMMMILPLTTIGA